jgi:hypothetical protein
MCAPESAWGTPWLAQVGRAAPWLVPSGRTPPPQIGRGRRGCGRGGHHPPLRPGAAGVSPSRPARPPGLPDPAGIRRFRKGVHRPMYFLHSPSGEASFPWGRAEAQPSPPLAPRPPGLETQGKPVCPFASHLWWPVRAPQEVQGPPLQPFPSYSGSLLLSLAMVFTGPSPVDAGYCAESYSPWLTWPRHRPRQGSEASRGEVPPLERGTCCLPAFTPIPSRFFVAFLPTRFRSSGYSSTRRQGRTPGGATRSREGIAPSPLQA